MKEYKTKSYEETVELGKKVAKSLPKGSLVAFLGGLGMGKTAFTTVLQKDLALMLMFLHRLLLFAILILVMKIRFTILICIVLTVGMTFILPVFSISLKQMHIWQLNGAKMFTAHCLMIL
mgnify:CR=1 FL=1